MPETPKLKRWLIEGQITTLTPLHIGDGSTFTRKGSDQEIARVAKDANGNPYLPGSSLRGFLRTNFENCFDKSEVEDLFGFQDRKLPGSTAESKGGLLSVWDAFSSQRIETQVQHHVVINRQTRTAAEHLLFAQEIVPANSKFSVTLVVEGLNASRDHVQQLLAVLNHLHESGQRLGAGAADNHGHILWTLEDTKVRVLDADAIAAWAKSGGQLNQYLSEDKVDPCDRNPKRDWKLLKVKLRFEDLFLVNDPDRSKGGPKSSSAAVDAEALRLCDTKPVLPASEFLGALRNHAERIARTQGLNVQDVARPGRMESDLNQLDPIDCMFGGIGWRSPLQVEADFSSNDDCELLLQNFVAIDRFTGSSAESMLFTIRAWNSPQMEGTLKIDLTSLKLISAKAETALRLLAITLRDLASGEIPLGYATNKGFGHNTAPFSDEADKPVEPKELLAWLPTTAGTKKECSND